MIDLIKDLDIAKNNYLKKKEEYLRYLYSTYIDAFYDIEEDYRKLEEELGILLSNIPVNKSFKYRIDTPNRWYDSIVWRYPFDAFYYERRTYGVKVGDILKRKKHIKNYKVNLNDETDIDFSKIDKLDKSNLNLFIKFFNRAIDIKIESVEKKVNKFILISDQGGIVEYNNQEDVSDHIENLICIDDKKPKYINSWYKDDLKEFKRAISNYSNKESLKIFLENQTEFLNVLEEINLHNKSIRENMESFLEDIVKETASIKLLRDL